MDTAKTAGEKQETRKRLSIFGVLSRRLKNVLRRSVSQDASELERLDDRHLKDVGLCRNDISSIWNGEYFSDASRVQRKKTPQI